MSGRVIPIGEARLVEVSAAGDLTIGGWDQTSIQAEGDEWSQVTPEGSPDDPVRLRFDGDGRLRIPSGVTLRITDVGGDARIRDLSGVLEASNISGDLRIEEIRGPVQIESAHGDVNVQRISGPVTIGSAGSDVDVRRVSGPVSLDRAGGDARVEQISGPVMVAGPVSGDAALAGINGPTTIHEVAGDLNLIECQGVSIESIAGDLTAKDLRGSLEVDLVGGDAQIAGCDGSISLESIGGDLTARGLGAGLRAPEVRGRIRLNTAFAPGSSYDLASNGGTTILVDGDPSRVSATFELRRPDGGKIMVGLPLADPIVEPGFVGGRLGAGEAMVRVTSRGSLRLETPGASSTGFDREMFDEIGEAFRGAFGAFSGFGWGDPDRDPEERGQRRARRAEEKVQEAAQRMAQEAERQARKAAERAQRHIERAARQAERHAGNWRWFGRPIDAGPGWINPFPPGRPGPPRPPAPPSRPPASEEERLAILNMLAAGTITADDAARLLEAIG